MTIISEEERIAFAQWSEERIELLGEIEKLKNDVQRYKQKNVKQSEKIQLRYKENRKLKAQMKQIVFWGLIALFMILTIFLLPIIQSNVLQAIISLSFFGFMAWFLISLSVK